jgi:enediyne biosynthesis protein E7
LTSTSGNSGDLPPGPRGLTLIRALWRMKRSRLAFLSQMAHDFGGVVRFTVPGRTIYLVSEPLAARHILVVNVANYAKGLGQREAIQLVGEGLLTTDSVAWPHQRRALETLFNPARMGDLARSVGSAVERLDAHWARCARSGTTTELIRDVKEVALHIVDDFLLAGGLAPRVSVTLSRLEAFERLLTSEVLNVGPSLPDVPFSRTVRLRRIVADLHRIIDEVIDHCRTVSEDNIVACMQRHYSPEPDDIVLRSQVATFLLAGYETTAAALAWVWYLLDRYPDKTARLRDELRAELAGRVPGLADVNRLSYTRAVVLESLRLFPPVWVLPRTAIHADTMSGFAVPPGTEVLISPYLIHRRADFWADPESFSPERFLEERLQPQSSYAYLPFGAGPRACIGAHTATVGAVLAVASLAQRFRLTRSGGSLLAPQAQVSLFPGASLPMRVHRT